MIRRRAVILIALAFAGSFGGVARAGEPPCDLARSIADLKTVQDAGAAVSLLEELEARREMLRETLRCADLEAGVAHEKLSRVDPVNDAMGKTKGELLVRLTRAREYLRSQQGRLPDLGIYGTREFARTVRDWRQGSYGPLVAQAQNFALWQTNQPIIDTASRRLDHVEQTLRTLGLVNQGAIKDPLSAAGDALRASREANDRAAAGIRSSIGPEDVAEAIRSSLRSLADFYEALLRVSEEVKKIVPV